MLAFTKRNQKQKREINLKQAERTNKEEQKSIKLKAEYILIYKN